ncbi:hypothetical protein KZZ52_43680 [Dactylosporangium sp. AC04546]|uniref:hypothetical protein n=1 Tax=Dactylosporangium sp. AC04546 TaxID=2862460 RepID=UPI001EDD7F29|nr:hypothetical protein [Dactylosporangium sp. AC04546]WVK80816.1 hypothetical protein KZZ52_43680 [Dactylosporangium sp. AC04546]
MNARRPEPSPSRAPVIGGAVAFVVIVVLQASAGVRQDWAVPFALALFGVTIAAAIVVLVRVARASRRDDPSAWLVLTCGGFAVRPAIPLGPVLGMLSAFLGLQVGPVINEWRAVIQMRPTVVVDAGLAFVMSVPVLLGVVAVALMVPVAWRGYAVELTPAGIRSSGPLHRRVLPWQALAAQAGHQAGRVWLVVDQPDLVLQRGVPVLDSRERPTLSAGRAGPVLTEAIAWYLAHPGDRACIGTVAGYDRLRARLNSAAPIQPTPPPPAAAALGRPGPTGAIVRLVHAAAVIAAVIAAADLSIAIVFRDRLLAAEHAIAAADQMPPEGELLFTTDTVGFATGSATVALIVTLVLATVGVALVHKVRAGSGPARTGLTIVSGVVAVMSMCAGVASVVPLATEPAAGTGLNVWAAFRMIESMSLTGLALLVLVLLVFSNRYPVTAGRTVLT